MPDSVTSLEGGQVVLASQRHVRIVDMEVVFDERYERLQELGWLFLGLGPEEIAWIILSNVAK